MSQELDEMQVAPDKEVISHSYSGDLSQTVKPVAQKEQIRKTYDSLKGVVGSGTFGGHLQPLSYLEYLAGSEVGNISVNATIKVEPLRHVNLDNLKVRFYAVYVPNVAIWDSARRFSSQSVDVFDNTIPQVPSFQPTSISTTLSLTDVPSSFNIFESTFNRDTITYAYYGDWQNMQNASYNILLHRGYKKIWNDIFRPKNYASKLVEYTDDIPTQLELQEVMNFGYSSGATATALSLLSNASYLSTTVQRISATTNYYNDYRLQVYSDNSPVDNTTLFSHNVTQQMIDEYRSQQANSTMTDEEVISRIRGTSQARENIPQIIGQYSHNIELSIQPQTSEGEMLLGDEGAISYTHINANIEIPSFSNPNDGYIHIFWTVQAPDNSIPVDTINVDVMKTQFTDFYRPSMKNIKDAPLYSYETMQGVTDHTEIVGWKRRFSEYFRLPTVVRGDYKTFSPQLSFGIPLANRHNSGGWQVITQAHESQIVTPISGSGNTLSHADFTGVSSPDGHWGDSAAIQSGSLFQINLIYSDNAPSVVLNVGDMIQLYFTTDNTLQQPPLTGSAYLTGTVQWVHQSSSQILFQVFVNTITSGSSSNAVLSDWTLGTASSNPGVFFNLDHIVTFGTLVTNVGSIEDKTSWHFLRDSSYLINNSTQDLYPFNPQTDYTDIVMQRLLIFSGVPYSNALVAQPRDFRIQSPYTFKLYGNLSVGINQPIDREIRNNFIGYGEE